ncbi:dihydroorotase [Maridesulfovibrio hydrothermalis]|uniref:Dihydroorotase n=1 Tax=Maridesulfovibrio hydrothermalis AM13 = DSM 14728 TaxID=1121451 RepID=L0R8B0_9BACT|nr:dihydroorotase [Maridesulfovibrio hydrothermalis]CCO22998.1 Dihydroorotase [Maridesulfovibrio hydrothermalis AM13 = DSM 14728]
MTNPELVVRKAVWKGDEVDLLVADGKILNIIPSSDAMYEGAEVVAARGLLLMPSLTDVHTHLREPGFEYKEDIRSGLTAAVHGGFSNIMCMANTDPVNDNSVITDEMLAKAKAAFPEGGPRLFPVGALTKKLEGKELSPMHELAEAGCMAFSNDGLPVKSSEVFRRAMEYASDTGRPVIDHCEDPYLEVASGMNEGKVSSLLGLAGQPDVAEASQVARDLLMAEYLDMHIHLAHISCRKSVDLIAWAKKRGVKVTAETCPHYLLLTEEAVHGYGTDTKVNPPLRTADDVVALLNGIKDGTIDMFATDHAPHAAYEKEVEFMIAPCGISSLDTALSLTWSLVAAGKLTFDDFIRMWTTAPCETFGLPLNSFNKGDVADFFLFAPDEEWTLSPENMHSKGKNTPFMGQTLKGRVISHFLSGKKIV